MKTNEREIQIENENNAGNEASNIEQESFYENSKYEEGAPNYEKKFENGIFLKKIDN